MILSDLTNMAVETVQRNPELDKDKTEIRKVHINNNVLDEERNLYQLLIFVVLS